MLVDFERVLLSTVGGEPNYTPLGEGTDEELKAAWEEVYTEYASGSNDPTTKHVVYNTARIQAIDMRIEFGQAMLNIAAQTSHPDALKALRKEYLLTFKPETMEADCNKVLNQLKQLISDRETFVDQLKKYESKKEGGKAIDVTYFDHACMNFQIITKTPLRKQDITVQQFVIAMNQLNDYVKSHNPKK